MEDIDSSIFDVYFSLMEDSSESPFLYHRWTLISAVAALLGRRAYFKFGFETIYPNMYVCLLGNAGTRKSSSISIGRKLAKSTGYNKFARERSSKEKFIKDLAEGFDKINSIESTAEEALAQVDAFVPFDDRPASEVYITASELEDFLGQGDQAFISLLTNLWDNQPHYSHGKMTSADLVIKEPTINMIGGATPVTFSTVFPPEVIGQGMLSRMLLVFGAGVRKRITIPTPPDAELLQVFQDTLATVANNGAGEYMLGEGAYEVIDDVYQSGYNLGDTRFESYSSRRHTHLLKLCIVITALERDDRVITRDIAIQANTILYYTETLMPKALGQFGRSKNSEVTHAAYANLCEYYSIHKVGLSWTDWFKRVSTDFSSRDEFGKMMKLLKDAGKVMVKDGTIVPCEAKKAKSLPHVKLNLLREYRDEVNNE